MNRTIAYYNENARNFCEATKNADMGFCREKFLRLLNSRISGQGKIHILDAGCGSGRDARAFLDAGYRVTAMDASAKICDEAEKLLQQKVLCISFEELGEYQAFDGIWACASLLHVPYNEIDDVLKKLWTALRENGILYASFKYGEGMRNVGVRVFYDYKEDALKELMVRNHFRIEEVFMTQDVRPGREDERWLNVLAGKEDCESKQ